MYIVYLRLENNKLRQVAKFDRSEAAVRLVHWLKDLWPEDDYEVRESSSSTANPAR